MKLAADKILHLQLGAAVALALLVVAVIVMLAGVPLAVLTGSVAASIGYEVVQRIRGDGVPSWTDAAASAVPGALLALVLYLTGWP